MRFNAKDKALLYHELAKLLEAGFPMEKALSTLEHHPLPEGCMHYVRTAAQHLKEGRPITEAVTMIEDIELTGVEKNLIQAGERGGQLEDVFSHLATYFERVHETRRSVIRGLIYPAVVLHIAAFLPALPKIVAGAGLSAIWSSFGLLAIFYVVGAVLLLGYRFLNTQSTEQGSTDRLLSRVPILGKLRRMLALERFTEVFRIYLLSAFKPSEAIEAAGKASQSGYLKEHASTVSEQLASGQTMGPLLMAHGAFPKDFAAGMSTAEESGTLDQELRRWANHYGTRVQEGFAQLEAWLPKIIFSAIFILVAWMIIQSYLAYLNQVTDMLDF